MSNNEFDLDSILAEFSGKGQETPNLDKEENNKNKPEEDDFHTQEGNDTENTGDQTRICYVADAARINDIIEKKQKKEAMASSPEADPGFKPEGKEYTPPAAWAMENRAKSKASRQKDKTPDVDKYLSEKEKREAERLKKEHERELARLDAQKSAMRKKEREDKEEHIDAIERRDKQNHPLRAVLAVIFALLSIGALMWVGLNIHPDSGTAVANTAQTNLNLISKLDVYANNAASDALSDVTYIKKVYTIDESATSAPAPNQAAFGTTINPSDVTKVVEDAAELLDGQELLWNENRPFYMGSEINYYRDPTILAITWKELVDGRCATFAEIKVAHGSQFRRKLTEDFYGSSVQAYASKLAADANAVVASNADFYGFRNIGIKVYNRQVFSSSSGNLDTCFINSAGDMLFARAGELEGDEAVNKFVKDNDVLFSLSFGPVLVDNGELQYCPSYPIGEIDVQYSRAALGMLDDLHYLVMTINHTIDGKPRAMVNQMAQYMFDMGCKKAYGLDGGQTSEIVMNGEPVNYIDFGKERTVTDIIYFATALPESEVGK